MQRILTGGKRPTLFHLADRQLSRGLPAESTTITSTGPLRVSNFKPKPSSRAVKIDGPAVVSAASAGTYYRVISNSPRDTGFIHDGKF
jgi:hypothetical protein